MEKRPTVEKLRGRIKIALGRLEGYGDNVKKRKLEPEHALAVLTCDNNGQPSEEYDLGKKYRPKRKNPHMDLNTDSDEHFEPGRIVSNWDIMDPRPTASSQDILTDCISVIL